MRNSKKGGYISGTGSVTFSFVKGGILVNCYRVATTIETSFADVDESYGTSAAVNFQSNPIEPTYSYLGAWVMQNWKVFVPFNKIFKITIDRESPFKREMYFVATPKGVVECNLWTLV
jgi:hypothetical protein